MFLRLVILLLFVWVIYSVYTLSILYLESWRQSWAQTKRCVTFCNVLPVSKNILFTHIFLSFHFVRFSANEFFQVPFKESEKTTFKVGVVKSYTPFVIAHLS